MSDKLALGPLLSVEDDNKYVICFLSKNDSDFSIFIDKEEIKAEKIGILTGFIFLFSPAYFFYSNIIEVTNVFIPILLIWTYFYMKIYLKNYKTNYIYIIFTNNSNFISYTNCSSAYFNITYHIFINFKKTEF